MRWLVRLITPPNGTVLDPFMGSGTTGMACIHEEFNFIGIEKEPEYVEIAKRRIAWAEETKPDSLFSADEIAKARKPVRRQLPETESLF